MDNQMAECLSNNDIVSNIINSVGDKSYMSFIANKELLQSYKRVNGDDSISTTEYLISAVYMNDLPKVKEYLTEYKKEYKQKKIPSKDYKAKTKLLCDIAALNGKLECLSYLHKNGCSWDAMTSEYAAESGNFDCLKYIMESNCKKSYRITQIIIGQDNLEVLKYLHSINITFTEIDMHAAASKSLDCLKYLRENGCDWDEEVSSTAARSGNLDCLKYLHENGCPWDIYTTKYAAENGNLDCLKYAYEKGCPMCDSVFRYAAYGGNVNCMKYVQDNGYIEQSSRTLRGAIMYGHLDCLKYAYENGCPYDDDMCFDTVREGSLECLKYLHSIGCTFSAELLALAELMNKQDLVEYIKEVGF